MSIDTYSKRLSVMALGLPWRQTLPDADGSFDQGDRQHFLALYSGVEEVAATAGFYSGFWFVMGGLIGAISASQTGWRSDVIGSMGRRSKVKGCDGARRDTIGGDGRRSAVRGAQE